MSELSFAIYASGRCSKMSGRGIWVASTYADGPKPYSVEFDGVASCDLSQSLIVKALTRALTDLDRDGRLVILYVDDPGLAGTIASIVAPPPSASLSTIAPKPLPDSAGSGPVWERFLFQLRRHDVLLGRFDPTEKCAKALRERLAELLAEESR